MFSYSLTAAPAAAWNGGRRVPRPGPAGRRLPLTGLTRKHGARNTLVLAYAVSAIATLLLFTGGTLVPALLLSLFAGASIGAVYTLQGVYAYELVDPRHLGMVLGIQQAVFAIGGAMGPAAAGALLGITGSYVPAISIITAGFAAAAGVLLFGRITGQARARLPAARGDRGE